MTNEQREKYYDIFSELIRLYEDVDDEKEKDRIGSAVREMRFSGDLIFVVLCEDYAEVYKIVEYHSDEESPDGRSHSGEVWTVYDDGHETDYFDAGCLWGYFSAKSMAESECGYRDDNEENLYILDWNSHLLSKLDMTDETTWQDVMDAIKDIKPVKWEDIPD